MSINNFSHIPVLLAEATDALMVAPGHTYIDGTLGGGGHTKIILEKGGKVLGIDKDEDAIEYVKEALNSYVSKNQLTLVKGSFSDIKKIGKEAGYEQVDGILFDVGVSSYQLDASGRGFSIRRDEVLDMRMDMNQKLSAYEVVNSYPKEKLIEIFYRFGEEHNAVKIAEEIVATRKKADIRTTNELVQIVMRIPHRNEPIHPATRIFQAIRIEVNSELDELKRSLADGCEMLNPKGRMVVISFHSLEDRVVKQSFDLLQRNGWGMVVTKKPIIATSDELAKNKRARSAKMRIFERKQYA